MKPSRLDLARRALERAARDTLRGRAGARDKLRAALERIDGERAALREQRRAGVPSAETRRAMEAALTALMPPDAPVIGSVELVVSAGPLLEERIAQGLDEMRSTPGWPVRVIVVDAEGRTVNRMWRRVPGGGEIH